MAQKERTEAQESLGDRKSAGESNLAGINLWRTGDTDGERLAASFKSRARSSEDALLLAVFEDAVLTLKFAKPTAKGKTRYVVSETRAWFASERADYCFTFEAICDRFGWNPDWIRRQVNQFCDDPERASRRNLVRDRPPYRKAG